MSGYAYAHLRSPQNTATGVADKFLWAPISDFTTISCPTPSTSSPVAGDQVTVTVAHTFAAGKGFFEFVTAPGTGKFEGKTVGELGSQKFDQSVEYFLPGDYPALHEFAKNAANQPGIGLVQDANCAAGIYHQIGCDCKYCWLSFEWSAGEEKAGRKGYKVMASYVSDAVLTYTAAVAVHP